uniref:Luc7-like protein 3 n=1 Tax=Phallusia mammillata TaxID=59560 RepID=A0A6F9DKK7_9ASCI|nr:luc7-like protein 3 [Phallusia mammillata]
MTALSAMLDELMGKNRNAAPNEQVSELHWSDDDVCKHFLCGFCPAELFTNTRSDLGVCNKIHDDRVRKVRKNYESSSRYMKMGYEEDFLRFLQNCWQDVERRIRRNHQRLQLTEEKNQKQQVPSNNSELDEKLTVLNTRITEMLENIEKLGSEGEVEQAQAMMKLCEQLKDEREQLQAQKGGQIMDTFSVQEKQMEVCEVCGAFLIVGDAQSRVDDHLMGKQHMGYAKIKSTIAELKEKLTKASEANREERKQIRTSARAESTSSKDKSSHDRSSRERTRKSRDRDPRDDRRSDHHRSRESNKKRSREHDHKSDTDRRSSRDRDRRSERRGSRERRRSRERDHKSSRTSSDRDRRSRDHKESSKRTKDRSRSRERKRSRKSEDKSSERKKESKHSEKKSEGQKETVDRVEPGEQANLNEVEQTEVIEGTIEADHDKIEEENGKNTEE